MWQRNVEHITQLGSIVATLPENNLLIFSKKKTIRILSNR